MMSGRPWRGLTPDLVLPLRCGAVTEPNRDEAHHAPAAHSAPAASPAGDADDPGSRWVAALLAAAAVLAAVLAMRAAFLIDDAGDAWQSALRAELKRSVNLIEDVRYVYGTEGDQAFSVVVRESLADGLRVAGSGQPGPIADALITEARVHELVLERTKPEMELTAGGYTLPDGGYDLAARLADRRLASPEIVALDPEELQSTGDRASRHSIGVVYAAVPVGLALLLGSLAMPYRRRRRVLLALGWLALGLAAAAAIALEVSG